MSFCVCDSICPQSHLCDIPQSLFVTSLSSCFPCLFVCCSKFHQLSPLFATPLSLFFSPSLFCVCYSVCLPPQPVCMASHPIHQHPVFSFWPPLFYICYNSIFQLSHLYYSPPSLQQPCLLSSPPPLFCVYHSICHPPPLFSLVPLPSFVSVIPFTNTFPCISPLSVPLLVFSLTPPILCVCHSLHQHFHLYLPSICATPCLLSNPSPLLCQLFLSPTLQPVSPLPLYDSLSSL